MLSKIAKNLFTGQSITTISLPVDIFATDSNLNRHRYMVRIPIILRLFEVVEHVFVTPSWVALCLPCFVVLLVPPHVQHVVEHGRAADDLATRPVAAAVLHAEAGATWLRLCLVLPVHASELEEGGQGGNIGDFSLISTSFEKEDIPISATQWFNMGL